MPHDVNRTSEPLPRYETPTVTVMDEKKVLEVFQIQTAASSWWF